jgi:hypothetical protein
MISMYLAKSVIKVRVTAHEYSTFRFTLPKVGMIKIN